MATAMHVILLEHVDSLGNMGETVRVKPGYARNYLLPQGKALRATEKNVAYFETQKSALEKLNAEKRAEAQKHAKKLDGLKVVLIRHASESGQLYGSVATRDIADAINEKGKHGINRNQVTLNTALKTIGLFPVTVALHPEVKIEVTVNIARSEQEAKIQAETGKALIADTKESAAAEAKVDAKAMFLEDAALEIEQTEAEAEAAEAAEEAEKAAKRAEKAASKKPKKAKAAAEEEAETEE